MRQTGDKRQAGEVRQKTGDRKCKKGEIIRVHSVMTRDGSLVSYPENLALLN